MRKCIFILVVHAVLILFETSDAFSVFNTSSNVSKIQPEGIFSHLFNFNTGFKKKQSNVKSEDVCFHKLHEFAVSSSQFTNCIIQSARPISMCRNCSDEYDNATKVYNAIKHSDDCTEVILNADRIQIVEKIYEEIITMWETANCDNCYEDNASTVLKNSTKYFFELIQKTLTCFKNTNATICPLDKNGTYCPNAACTSCLDIYKSLNHFYRSLQEKYDFENLCMDITDAMNSTRKIWSIDLECTHYNNDTFVLFVIVSFICLFPVVFYLSNWLHSDEHKSKIVPQKRLATSRSFAQLSVNSYHTVL